MKNKNLYIKILEWAYNESERGGFTKEKLNRKFQLTGEQWAWISSIFFKSNKNDESVFIKLLKGSDKDNLKEIYFLSDKGLMAYINNKQLTENRKNTDRAIFIAILAIAINIVVGIIQILY